MSQQKKFDNFVPWLSLMFVNTTWHSNPHLRCVRGHYLNQRKWHSEDLGMGILDQWSPCKTMHCVLCSSISCRQYPRIFMSLTIHSEIGGGVPRGGMKEHVVQSASANINSFKKSPIDLHYSLAPLLITAHIHCQNVDPS